MSEKHTLLQRIVEVRYERGYRYLDRCGEVMLILDELLPQETGKVWLPEETAPSGARLKCPQLDITLHFNAERMNLSQSPAEGSRLDIGRLAQAIFTSISARFDLRIATRFGLRQIWMVPNDSIEEAEAASLHRIPLRASWPVPAPEGMKIKNADLAVTFEVPNHSAGIRFQVRPGSRIDAPLEVDERLNLPPHMLPSGQREALIDQLRRRKQKEEEPLAGLVVDVDYYSLRPVIGTLEAFLASAKKETSRFLQGFIEGKS